MLSFKRIHEPSRIIISRIDNIGDVIFTFPLVSLLKNKYPKSHIFFLARGYVKDLIDLNPQIDDFLDWSYLCTLSDKRVTDELVKLKADVIVNVFPNTRLAKIAKFAKIPFRVSRLSKPIHLLYSNKLKLMSRRDYSKHESELVNKLLNCFNIDNLPSINEMDEHICLNHPKDITKKAKAFLHAKKFNLILHPGSNGNGKEWSAKYYTELIKELDQQKINVILTGSSAEKDRFQEPILAKVKNINCSMGALELKELIQLIAHADGFIGSGTGPTHVAAALNIPTLGLFPKEKKIGIGRWRPIGKKVKLLVSRISCKNCRIKGGAECLCMDDITVSKVMATVESWLAQKMFDIN